MTNGPRTGGRKKLVGSMAAQITKPRKKSWTKTELIVSNSKVGTYRNKFIQKHTGKITRSIQRESTGWSLWAEHDLLVNRGACGMQSGFNGLETRSLSAARYCRGKGVIHFYQVMVLNINK